MRKTTAMLWFLAGLSPGVLHPWWCKVQRFKEVPVMEAIRRASERYHIFWSSGSLPVSGTIATGTSQGDVGCAFLELFCSHIMIAARWTTWQGKAPWWPLGRKDQLLYLRSLPRSRWPYYDDRTAPKQFTNAQSSCDRVHQRSAIISSLTYRGGMTDRTPSRQFPEKC
jgi:hypothetical protein